jgi:GMP synthase (glutamine-hydrolysing)
VLLLATESDDEPALLARLTAARAATLRLAAADLPRAAARGLVVYGRDLWGEAVPTVAAAIDRGLPVLGIGAGGLAVAAALAAEIVPDGAPQFGFVDVEALPAARDDAVARATAPGLPLLHWHADAMALPAGATLLLRCARGRVQAFRAAPATYAFLAPLLADAETIRRWAAERARAKNNPAFAIRLSGEIERHQGRAEAAARAILEGWLDLTETRS